MAGNVYNIVVLSSSPPPSASSAHHGFSSPQRQRVAMPRSSPPAFYSLPSPKKTSVGASKSPLKCVPGPERAARGFATVSSLVRSEHFADQLEHDLSSEQRAPSRRGPSESVRDSIEPLQKPQKRSARGKSAAGDDRPKPKPKPRARKAKADSDAIAEDPELRLPEPKRSPFFDDGESTLRPIAVPSAQAPNLTKSGKPRKVRAKKQTTESGVAEPAPKPRKPRTSKAKAAQSTEAQCDPAPVVSAHFCNGAPHGDTMGDGSHNVQASEQNITDIDAATIWEVPKSPRTRRAAHARSKQPVPVAVSLELDEAVSRRGDWTPPTNTTAPPICSGSSGKENAPMRHDESDEFLNLISGFTYAQPAAAQKCADLLTTSETAAATKRRRIELVEIPNNQSNSRDTSPEKGKAPKKKARTITDLVTEQYAPKEPTADPDAIPSNFFGPKSSTTKVPLNDVAAQDGDALVKKPIRRRKSPKSVCEGTNTKAKTKKAAAKPKKPKLVAEVLLSPSSALTRVNKQDILFGTSSQLAMDESPTMIRQIQQAIQQSEQDAHSVVNTLGAPPRWPKLEKVEGRKSLWSASNRDDDGSLLEHVENVYIPEPDRSMDVPLLMDGACDVAQTIHGATFADIENIDTAPLLIISSDHPSPPLQVPLPPRNPSFSASLFTPKNAAFEDIDDIEQEPPPSNQHAYSQHSFVDIDDLQPATSSRHDTSAVPKLRPPASTPNSASPKKRRGRPPKVQSAVPTALTSSDLKRNSSAPSPQTRPVALLQPTTPPKSSSRFIDIEEILDSEEDVLEVLSPTPPRMIKFHDIPSLPLVRSDGTPVKPSKTTKLPVDEAMITIHRISTAHLEWTNIKPTIFAALTAHIRSLPPTTDPKKPSWHEKILMYDPIVLEEFTAYLNADTPIRAYKKATQKQIKAWNQQLKLAGEPTFGVGESGEEVLAVEKLLETYMVQGWCESMSICCIWGEGRGKGGARKGLY